MQKHDHFDELCSLAVIGELAGAELAEFSSHFGECMTCRANYAALAELAAEQLPLVSHHAETSTALSAENVRKRVLERIAGEGLRVTPEAIRGPISVRDHLKAKADDFRWSFFARRARLGVYAGVIVTASITLLGSRYIHEKRSEVEILRSESSERQFAANQLRQDLKQTRQAQDIGEAETNRLQAALADASSRAERLEAEYVQASSAMFTLQATVDRLNSENKALMQRTTGKDAELVALRGQLQQLRTDSGSREAELVASKYQIVELSDQLKAQQSALEHERQLLVAGRDIRDLMGARNLHIIDVHDMDSRGEARPFGRIFLTEGKRLIFYAYDLDSTKVKDASFQAWGQSANGRQKTVSLGILYLDDQRQSRWMLKVEDPNLLSAIDSVFVTVEPHGGREKPTGKKLMYAYLRNPINHP